MASLTPELLEADRLIPQLGPAVTLKRCHGLGNLICLLPVLDRLAQNGHSVRVITRSEWAPAMGQLRPQYGWICEPTPGPADEAINLDQLTVERAPSLHRTDEFAQLLGLPIPLPAPHLQIPHDWQEPFEKLGGCVVFAPEAAHPSRCWPMENAARLKNRLPSHKLVVVGTCAQPWIPADVDTRTLLQIPQLLGLLSIAGVIITMDSAVLHLAAALGRPTVAIFGGVDPRYRIRSDQPVVAIQAELPCCPCNKNETCQGHYHCIKTVTINDVLAAVAIVRNARRRIILKAPLAELSPAPTDLPR